MPRTIILSNGERYRMKMSLTSIARLSRFTDSEWRSYSAHMTVEKSDTDWNELTAKFEQYEDAAE